jgi:hypothetical protein
MVVEGDALALARSLSLHFTRLLTHLLEHARTPFLLHSSAASLADLAALDLTHTTLLAPASA